MIVRILLPTTALPALLAVLAAGGCRSDAPPTGTTAAPSVAPSVPSAANRLDVTPLPGAPSLASISGWWVVETTFKAPGDDPGARPGSAWWFGPGALRLIFGDSHDKRPILKSVTEGDTLRIEVEGSGLELRRRALGLTLKFDDEPAVIPLRPATPNELKQLDALDKKRAKMFERACEKALHCCVAAQKKHVAKDNDCQPLMATTDLDTCIAAVALYKRKAGEANVVIPECLPDQ